jgi:hypothetical protein
VRIDVRSKKHVLLVLAVFTVIGLAGGAYAAWRSRHDTICPNGKPPVAQRGEVIGQTEYRCSDGRVVTK